MPFLSTDGHCQVACSKYYRRTMFLSLLLRGTDLLRHGSIILPPRRPCNFYPNQIAACFFLSSPRSADRDELRLARTRIRSRNRGRASASAAAKSSPLQTLALILHAGCSRSLKAFANPRLMRKSSGKNRQSLRLVSGPRRRFLPPSKPSRAL
jgi:hypothetical protein